jgi:CDP-paratose 2-epimerase
VLEAIAKVEALTGRKMNWAYSDGNRSGDHIWWISDVRRFRSHCPDWTLTYDINTTISEIHDSLVDRTRQTIGSSR